MLLAAAIDQDIDDSHAEIGLRDFADPDLLFELSYYYGEAQGVADNFVRYSEFTERAFWPVALSDTSRFYDEDLALTSTRREHEAARGWRRTARVLAPARASYGRHR